MAACGSLDHIPENPMLFESLSPWKHINSINNPSFAEIFGELNFKENHNVHIHHPTPVSPSPSPSPSQLSSSSSFSSNSSIYSPQIDSKTRSTSSNYCQKKQYRHSDSFSSMNSESLSMCTEGLGFESFDDADDFRDDDNVDRRSENRRNHHHQRSISRCRGELPPPISCIGRSGKPWVCFRSYREDGRFILKEVRIPTQEFLHAYRENGRLTLQFVQHDEDEDKDEDECNIQKQSKDDESKNENVQDGDCNNSQILLV